MTVSIGIDYMAGQWKSCVVDQGRLTELHTFVSLEELLTSIGQLCTIYPEPAIGVSLDLPLPFSTLKDLADGQSTHLLSRLVPTVELCAIWESLSTLSFHGYCAPAAAYLPTIPLARRLLRPSLGNARDICIVIALLHHMRSQDASWQEMNFFYVNASKHNTSILVLKDGQIINGIGTLQGSSSSVALDYLKELGHTSDDDESRVLLQQALQDAFWEGLTEELAGLIAIHHIEDIVVLGERSNQLVERLAETYQVYLFPYAQSHHQGYEAALGAALLAEGLDQPGHAAELVDYLQIRQASHLRLSSDLSL